MGFKLFLIVSVLLLFCSTVLAEPPIEWELNVGENLEEVIYDISRSSDGGYIAAGTKYIVNTTEDIYVVKITASGDVEWERSYVGSKEDFAHSIKQTSDGGYILCGGTFTETQGVNDFAILKLDPSGNIQWEQKYGGNQRDVCEAIIQIKDGGYMAVGDRWLNYYDRDIYLIKLDPEGNIEWDLGIGGGDEDGAYDIRQTPDKGYIIAGYTRSVSDLSYNVFIVKTDPDGRVEWNAELGGSGDDQVYSIVQQKDGYVAAGYTTSYSEFSDIYVVKVNLAGEKVWEKVLGGGDTQEDARSIKQTSDGGYILAGRTNQYSYGSYDMNLIKLDRDGNLEWSQVFGGQNSDLGYSVLESADKGYVIAGQTKSLGNGGDGYIVKTEGTGTSIFGKKPGQTLPPGGTPANGIFISIMLVLIAGWRMKGRL